VFYTLLRKCRGFGSITYIFLLIYPGYGWAGVWQQASSARIAEEYDTNPAMLDYANRKGAWRSIIVPSYTIKNSGEQSELGAGITLHLERSSNKSQIQNRNDPSVFVSLRHQGDTVEFGLTAKYDESATRNNLIDNAGQNFTDSTRTARTISGNWSKEMSEFSTISVDSSLERVSYQGGNFVNYNNRSSGVKFSHAMSEGSTLFVKAKKNIFTPTNGISTSDITIVLLGWEWISSDYLRGTLEAGKSRIKNSGTGTQGSASVNFTGQRTGLTLNAGRQISPSGLGNLVTIDQANVSWTYVYSEFGRLGIESDWQKSRLFTSAYSRSTSTWIQRELNPLWVVRMYYLHKGSDQVGTGKAYSNMLGLGFTYTHSDF